MPRSVNTVASRQKRKKILKKAKGYFGRRKNVYTVAKNAVEKALSYAYRDRKAKKRIFRSLWITRINAASREHGMSYSEVINKSLRVMDLTAISLAKESNIPIYITNIFEKNSLIRTLKEKGNYSKIS